MEFDSPIPDYCPDIARLIKVDCTPFVENCETEGDKSVIKGKAVYDVLYETDYKNRLRCCNFTQDFSISVPIPRSEAEDTAAFCDCICEKISCKLLSPRRAVIKSTLGATVIMEGEIPAKTLNVADDKETFFRKKTIGFEGRTNLYTENFRFGDSLSLAQSERNIGEIVCGNITLQPSQITISPSRAEIKTNALIHALCEEENNEGKYYMALKTLPISIDYQNDAIEEFKHISVSLEPCDCEFSPELDQYGESRVIKTSFNIKMKMKINEPKAYTVADDMFEKGFDSVLVKSSAKMPRLHSQTETSFSAEAKLPSMTPKPEILLDANARDYGITVEKAEGGINISGSFIATVLADTAEGIHSFDHSVPYNQFISVELPDEESTVSVQTYPIETIATLHSDGSATVRIIAGTKVSVYNETEEFFVSEVTKRVPREVTDQGAALIYFFPKADEDLWAIAKLYRTSPEAISEGNPKVFDADGKNVSPQQPILIKN